MITATQILETMSRVYSIDWDDGFTPFKGSVSKERVFNAGDEIALHVGIGRWHESVEEVLIYNANYDERYSIFFVIFGSFKQNSNLTYDVSSIFNVDAYKKNKRSGKRTFEVVNKQVSGEVIEWDKQGYNSYFTFLENRLNGYSEYMIEDYIPQRGMYLNGKKEGAWEKNAQFFSEDLEFAPFEIWLYANDELDSSRAMTIETKEDYKIYLSESNLPRIKQKQDMTPARSRLTGKSMTPIRSGLDWEKLDKKYELIKKDVCFKSID